MYNFSSRPLLKCGGYSLKQKTQIRSGDSSKDTFHSYLSCEPTVFLTAHITSRSLPFTAASQGRTIFRCVEAEDLSGTAICPTSHRL